MNHLIPYFPLPNLALGVAHGQILCDQKSSYNLTEKNAWFFVFERFGQSYVLKEWTYFNKRLRIVLIKEPAIFH